MLMQEKKVSGSFKHCGLLNSNYTTSEEIVIGKTFVVGHFTHEI